ncbi:MAG: hypothetical protein HC771_13850 [Synechococcales cyanobacterium CRU_2_2]|nr:hypothetical protein [Synechococcales cyanobacterium CRU_2_2]
MALERLTNKHGTHFAVLAQGRLAVFDLCDRPTADSFTEAQAAGDTINGKQGR